MRAQHRGSTRAGGRRTTTAAVATAASITTGAIAVEPRWLQAPGQPNDGA